MRVLGALVFSLALASAGCSDDPPTIRNLQYTPNAGNVGVQASINGEVDYADPNDDISQSQLELITPLGESSRSSPTPIMNVNQGPVGKVNFTLQFTPAEEGIYHFNFWIIDLLGRESNHLEGVIRVSPP